MRSWSLFATLRSVVTRRQSSLFALLLGVFALMLLFRVWNLRLLYLEAPLRSQVRSALESTAQAQGWLLSDISLQSVEHERIHFVHRMHIRGRDPAQGRGGAIAGMAPRLKRLSPNPPEG